MTLTETPIIQTLKSRKKGQKLAYKEKLEINKQVNEGTPLRDIWELFQVSLSTIKRIMKDFDKIKIPSKICSTIKSRSTHNPNLCKAIESFAKQEKRSFTWRDIMEHIMENFNICVDINTIREILIQRLGYSYKRWSPRPLMLNHKLTKLKKVLFSVKLLKLIDRYSLLINIDEATISQSTKSNYSWSVKGIPSNLSTITLKGSICIVSAIMSNGVSITGMKKGTIKSSTFIEFIQNLLTVWDKL